MIALEKVSTFVPERSVPAEELQEFLGLTKYQMKVFTKFHGLKNIAVDREMPLKEMLRRAISGLLAQIDHPLRNIEYILYGHTVQIVAPFPLNLIDELKRELGLRHALSFAITMQNCASGITALDLADKLLANSDNPEARVMIVTGEKALTPSTQLIPETTIMGEAATAVLVGRDLAHDRVLTVHRRILGQFAKGIYLPKEALQTFGSIYALTLVQTIREALDQAGLTLEHIRLILPHNVNLSSWQQVIKELDIPADRVYLKNIPQLGHCFSSDVILNYQSAMRDNLLESGDLYMMVSVGLGATFAVSILEH